MPPHHPWKEQLISAEYKYILKLYAWRGINKLMKVDYYYT